MRATEKTKNEKNAKLHKHFSFSLGNVALCVCMLATSNFSLHIPILPNKERACMHKDCL